MATTLDILIQEARAVGLGLRETAAFIATAVQESGLRADAKGDKNAAGEPTSFGLFQHHVGGAGGSTPESAMRYLDPRVAARERAKHFKAQSIDTGAEVVALQRPAERVRPEYIRNVDTTIRRILAGDLPKGQPARAGAAQLRSGQITQVIGPLDGPAADHMDHVHVAGVSTTGNKKDPTRDWVRAQAKAAGLTRTSGNRVRKHTASGNVSDHYVGNRGKWADDYAGTMEQMRAFNAAMRTRVGTTPVGTASGPTAGAELAQGDGSTTQTVGLKDEAKDALEGFASNLTFIGIVLVGVAIGGALIVGGTWRSFGGTASGAVTTAVPAARAAKAAGGK